MKLERWSIVSRPLLNPFLAPEQVRLSLHGRVYGNPNFMDGESITTTSIQGLIVEGDMVKIKTKNSIYELGEVDPGYEAAYPNALSRVKTSVTHIP